MSAVQRAAARAWRLRICLLLVDHRRNLTPNR
jgi:hypothetical protein